MALSRSEIMDLALRIGHSETIVLDQRRILSNEERDLIVLALQDKAMPTIAESLASRAAP